MRKRFRLDAVASSTGNYTRISHDRRANTTGRTERRPFCKCGFKLFEVSPMQAKTLAPCQLVYKL